MDLPDAIPHAPGKAAVRRQLLAARRALPAEFRRQAAVRVQATLLAVIRAIRPAVVAGYAPLATEPGGWDLPEVLAAELAAVGSRPAGQLLLPVLRPDLDLDWARFTGPQSLPEPTAVGEAGPAGADEPWPTGADEPRPADPDEPGPTDADVPRPATAGGAEAGGKGRHRPGARAGKPGRGLREPAGPRLGRAAIADAELVIVPAVAVDRAGVRLGRGGGSYDRALARVRPDALVIAPLYDGELVDRLPAEPHDARVDAAALPAAGLVWLSTGRLNPLGQ